MMEMNINSEYDKALYYTYRCNWDQLMSIMVHTEDEFFSKHIEHFLYAFQFEKDLGTINDKLQMLFQYIEHAQEQLDFEVISIQ